MSQSEEKKKKSAGASITTGLTLTLVFGIAWAYTDWWAFIFPMVFAGVLPTLEGIRRLRLYRDRKLEKPVNDEAFNQKQVLLTAKKEKGIVTPTVVALNTDLSIKEAEKILEEMAQMGYAFMNVNDDGRIEYEFTEFTPKLEDKS